MKPIYRRCCGIDVHKKSLSVCVLPPEGQQGIVKAEKFRTFLRDLKRLRAWLTKCTVTEVAMESTGQYWRPVWNVLEGHIPTFARCANLREPECICWKTVTG